MPHPMNMISRDEKLASSLSGQLHLLRTLQADSKMLACTLRSTREAQVLAVWPTALTLKCANETSN